VTLFDYLVLAVIGASLFLGIWRGLVSELLALVAWVAAFFAARAFATEIGAALFSKMLADPSMRYVAGFAAVFVATLVIISLLRLALRGMLSAAGLGMVDRGLGAVFGAARGLAIVLALVVVGGLTNMPKEPWWRDSLTAPPLETAVVAIRPHLPAALAKRIKYR
jgi:membrane protein required for colicin V production